MSQVATESQSSSSPQPTDIMTQRVHNNIDSSGIGNAESALPLKSIGLSSSSHSDPCPMELHRPRQQLSQDRVRRSRRLVERSAKIKNETTDTTSQRLAPRPIKQEPPHSSSQPSSQVAASTSSAPGPLPDPSHLPTNELPPPSSATPSTTTHNSTIVTAPSSPSHVNTAPESSTLTRSGLTNRSSTRENNFHGPLPDPSHLPTNELPPPSSATPSTTAHNSTIVTAPSSSPSHVNTAPESSALTRSGLTNRSSTRENNFHGAVSTRTPTSIQGSPRQHENSTYALTFASTAEEIPFHMRSSLETTPTAPPTSRTHDREASSNFAHFPRSNEATPIAPPISSGTATTLNTQMLGSIPTSVIQNSLARGTTSERNSNIHATATSRIGLPSSHLLLPTNFDDSTHIIENGASMHRSVPPLVCGMSAPTGHAQNHRPDGMLASTGHAQNHRPAGMLASTGHAQNHRPDGMSASTGHAQNDNRTGGINNETVSSNSASSTTTSNSSSNPLAALFEVPLPLSLPMGTDLHIPRTNPTNISLREERQRIEQSTAFIASHAQDRATTSSRRTSNTSSSSHNRRRWRRRENEEMASQSIEGEGVHVRERSSARQRRQQRVRDRDRSPVATTTTSQHDMTSSSATSSLLPRATSTRRRRHQRGGGGGAHSSRSGSSGPPPPLLGTSETSISTVPSPPSALLHVPISSTSSTANTLAGRNGAASDYRTQQHTCIGYQVVPQGQTSSVAAGSSNSGALGRPPLPHLHLSQGQGGMPVASNFHHPRRSSSSFHNPSSAAGGSSSAAESVVQVPMPQGAVHVPAPLSLPESHSGTILYPLSTSHSVPSMSHSHFPFHPPSSRHGMGVSVSTAEPVVIAADHEVPRFLREIDVVSRNSGISSRNSGRSGGGAEGGGGGERRESLVEVIVVDSSDSEHEDDDDVIVSGVSRVPSFPGHLPWTINRHQISSDEAFARRLQEEFDQEAHDVFAHVPPSISSRPQMVPPPPVPAGPSIPPPRHQPHNHHTRTADSGSLIRNNYEALVSHVERLTHHDAMTLLRITQSDAQRRTGRTPRTQGEYRRAMENMGEVLIVRAIMGSTGIPPTTYEDLLELAETLGPARPQGLPQEVINNFPVRNFRQSLETNTNGELPKCVVCMCEFEERERLRTLPCVHEFHKDCIDQWLKDHRTCPICRVELHSQQ